MNWLSPRPRAPNLKTTGFHFFLWGGYPTSRQTKTHSPPKARALSRAFFPARFFSSFSAAQKRRGGVFGGAGEVQDPLAAGRGAEANPGVPASEPASIGASEIGDLGPRKRRKKKKQKRRWASFGGVSLGATPFWLGNQKEKATIFLGGTIKLTPYESTNRFMNRGGGGKPLQKWSDSRTKPRWTPPIDKQGLTNMGSTFCGFVASVDFALGQNKVLAVLCVFLH